MSEVLEQIKQRQSDRISFDEARRVSEVDLRKILEAGSWAPTAHNMQNFEVIVVDDKKVLNEIAAIRRPISEEFVRENYKQLSFSEEELMKKKVGLLGAMFPPFMRTPGAELPKEGAPVLLPAPVLLVVLYDPSRRAPAIGGGFPRDHQPRLRHGEYVAGGKVTGNRVSCRERPERSRQRGGGQPHPADS